MSALVRSWSVGVGDMFYIYDVDNGGKLTVVDCCLTSDCKEEILQEIKDKEARFRFISTHPDGDHISGLSEISTKIRAFWSVANAITETNPSDDLKTYCKLRNDKLTITAGSSIALDGKSIGIDFLWPDEANADFKAALKLAESDPEKYNNISPIFTYTHADGAKFMWMGDLSSTFLEKIKDNVLWPHVTVLFAPHHGRDRVPTTILEMLCPKVIVIGEAQKDDLEYYKKYTEICQNTAKDILFECEGSSLHLYFSGVASAKVKGAVVQDKSRTQYSRYVGTIKLG